MSTRVQRQLGAVNCQREAPAITLPIFNIPDIVDTEEDIRDNARRFIEHRTIKAGLDAWSDVDRANSFENWKKIGAALLIGKRLALDRTGANRAMGRRYSRVFGEWIVEHHFEKMPSPTRSVAIELAEHAEEISAWRDGLSEKQRRRLVHPLSVTRRWRAATQSNGTDCQRITKTEAKWPPVAILRERNVVQSALAAWHHFLSCMEALPPADQAPLWQQCQTQAAAHLSREG